jgi:ribose transport system permease protein
LENGTSTSSLTEALSSERSQAATLNLVRRVWPWVFLILLVIFFTITSKRLNDVNFLNPRSVQGILIFTTQILLLALGETFIIIPLALICLSALS